MLAPVLVTPPASTPVSLVEVKSHLRVNGDNEDDLITAYIQAATTRLDGPKGVLGRVLVTQTWRADWDSFCDSIRLPFDPIQSITSIIYSDEENSDQTVLGSSYRLYADEFGSYVTLGYGEEWPSSVYTRADAVRVTFVAGYGAAADVPAPIRAAILLMVGDLYANRETVAYSSVDKIPMSMTVNSLIAPYRRPAL